MSSGNTGHLPLSTVGGRSLIPNDVTLDLGLLTSEECLSSLFSMRSPSSGSGPHAGNRRANRNNHSGSSSSGSIIGNSGPSDIIAQNQTTRRDYSTTHARKAYFGRHLCLKQIKLIYHN